MNTDAIMQYFSELLNEKIDLELVSYNLFEEYGVSKIQLKIKEGNDLIDVEGTGVGMIDAGFNCLIDYYVEKYRSLSTIKLEDVYFQIDHRAGKDISFKSKTEIKLEFSNHCKDRAWFTGRTKSMGFTGVAVLVKSIEFYINCELLFKRVKFLLEDAKDRSRPDIVSKYQYVLSRVVEVTNYQTIA